MLQQIGYSSLSVIAVVAIEVVKLQVYFCVCMHWSLLYIIVCRYSGFGGPCARLTRQTGPGSYSLWRARPRCRFRASPTWRGWTAHRSSRFTVTTDPRTACLPHTHGTTPASICFSVWYSKQLFTWSFFTLKTAQNKKYKMIPHTLFQLL